MNLEMRFKASFHGPFHSLPIRFQLVAEVRPALSLGPTRAGGPERAPQALLFLIVETRSDRESNKIMIPSPLHVCSENLSVKQLLQKF